VFEGRVVRRIFRPKTEAVMGHWRRLHDVVLHDFYFGKNIIRVIK
jgi:hypothetical protein